MAIEICNLHNERPKYPYDFRVDRATPVGNPFRIDKNNNRDGVCLRYRLYFRDMTKDVKFMCYVDKIIEAYIKYGELRLFCWCYPLRCHASTIAYYVESRAQGIQLW